MHVVDEVLSDYLRLKGTCEKSIGYVVTLGDEVLSGWMNAKSALVRKNGTHGDLFNPLQSIGIGETTHSALVGDLLNPHGSHGQGNLFLISFLTFLDVPEPAVGKWSVTIEKGRIDILLRRLKPHSVIVIENKANDAADQPNQLYRYWYRMIHLPHPKLEDSPDSVKRKFKLVYLAPRSSKEPVGHSVERPADWASISGCPARVPSELIRVVTFQELVNNWMIDPSVRIAETNQRLTAFLQLYSELWQSL